MKFMQSRMLGRAIVPALFAALTVAAGCEKGVVDPSANGAATLTTDSTSYTAIPIGYDQVVVKVVTRFTNNGSTPDTLERCFPNTPYPIFGVDLVSPSSNDGAAYSPTWACVGHNNPIVVPAGQTRIDTLQLHGPNAFSENTQRYLGVLEGTFRIGFGQTASNTFTIKLPPGGVVPYVPRDLSAAILTDSQLVHLKWQGLTYESTAPIHVTIFNPRADTSFIINCGGATGIAMEKLVGGTWIPAWGNVVPACLTPAIAIPPNGHYDAQVQISAGKRGTNVAPQFTTDDIPGVYRLVWQEIVDSWTTTPQPAWGQPVAVQYRRSNAFAIVVDP